MAKASYEYLNLVLTPELRYAARLRAAEVDLSVSAWVRRVLAAELGLPEPPFGRRARKSRDDA